MKKRLAAILAATMLAGVFPLTPALAKEEENLSRWATAATKISCQEDAGADKIIDGSATVGMVTESGQKPAFPCYVELDFGGYVAEVSHLRISSTLGKEMGVTNLGFEYWRDGKWQSVRSGEVLQWKQSDNGKAESRDVHFSQPPKADKFRLVIQDANLKDQAFRIDEVEVLGRLTGIKDKKDVKETEIGYIRCETGAAVSLPSKVSAVLADGSSAAMGVQWQGAETADPGVKTLLGNMPYYSIQPRMILDIYDPDADASAASGSWAEGLISNGIQQGLLGTLAPEPERTLSETEAALILFRAGSMKPKMPAEGSQIPNAMAGAEMAAAVEALCGNISAQGQLTRAKAAEWVVKVKPVEGQLSEQKLPFGDLDGVDANALAGIQQAFNRGIISSADSFRPFDAVTLAELLAMISKAEQGGQISAEGKITKEFADSGEVLVNPYMGIFSYYLDNGLVSYDIHYENDEYFEDVPGLSNIYIRVPWSVIEPEKGVYDFSAIDGAIEKFKRVGKQVSLRFTAAETGHVYATPKWVFDEGAKAHWWGYDGNDSYSMPHFDDPIFLANLDVFLGEVAKRYDGNPNIAYIDVGSLGIWGEGHTGSAGYTLTPDMARKHMELHAKHFKKTKVVVLDDMGQNFNDRFFPEVKDDVIRHGFGLRNDGYAGEDGKMRFILPEDKTLGDGIWEKAPIVMEPEHYGEMLRLDIWGDGVDLAHWIDTVHATYIGLHGYSKIMVEENPEFMEYANKRIGYRMLPEKVELTKESRVHGNLTMNVSWKNVAAAPCYNGAYPALTLKDKDGNIVSVMVDSKFNVKDLPVADPGKAKAVQEEAVFRLHDVLPGGTYQAYLSLGNITGEPEIAMPIEGNDGERRYYLGDVTVKGDYDLTVTQQAEDAITLHFELSPEVGGYTALWGNIALREQGVPQVYMPGEIIIGVNTAPLAEALKSKKACDIPVKLELPDQYKGKEVADKSFLIGKTFDVYYDMDTLGADMTPGMMLSGNGRSPKIGTAEITENLTIRFQPLES